LAQERETAPDSVSVSVTAPGAMPESLEPVKVLLAVSLFWKYAAPNDNGPLL